MWGNFTRGLKENVNVDALRETIGQVSDIVAPPLDSDEEEEYETDEEEEYEYYVEQEIEEKDADQNNKKESLGSMLQHMLDDEEEEHHRKEVMQQGERHMRPIIPLEDDDDIEEEVISFEEEPSVIVQQETTTASQDSDAANAAVNMSTKTQSPSLPMPPKQKNIPGVPVPHVHKETVESVPARKERILTTEPVRVDKNASASFSSATERPIPTTADKSAPTPPPKASVVESVVNESAFDYSTNAGRNEEVNGRTQESLAEELSSKTTTPDGTESRSKPQAESTNDAVVESAAPAIVETEETKGAPTQSKPLPPTTPPLAQKQSPPPMPTATSTPLASARSAPSPPLPPPPPPIQAQPAAEPSLSEPTQTTKPSSPPDDTPPPPKQKPSTQELLQKANDVAKHKPEKNESATEVLKLQRRCQELEQQLQHAEVHIVELQRDAAQRMDEEEEWRMTHLQQFQQEQARLVEAATEAAAQEHSHELAELRDLMQQECFALKQQLQEERLDSQQQVETLQRAVQEAEARVQTMETEKRRAESKQQSSLSQLQQQQEHAVRRAEDKLAHTLAKLDDKEEEVTKLKAAMKQLKASTTEHKQASQEAEEEMDQLHHENETLHHNLQAVEAERDELNKQLKLFESQKEKMHGLQMELRMLKEARDRERAHRENAAVDAESSQAELVAERDVALSTARDLERQLKATLADLDIAKADADRIMMANVNLQNALEAFQSERDAEMSLIEEQRAEAEQATAAAHAAAIEATHEANEARMREVQTAADAAVKNVMREVHELEGKLEDSRKENTNLRRSLDEAIHRLQASQEDVIDRVLMKNILLDWFSKSGKSKREVLALMASVLHFTEEEKNAIHIDNHSGGSTLGKVVGAVAAPLPPSAADIDHLEGDTVREKFYYFMLAETGGEDEEGQSQGAKESHSNEPRPAAASNGDSSR